MFIALAFALAADLWPTITYAEDKDKPGPICGTLPPSPLGVTASHSDAAELPEPKIIAPWVSPAELSPVKAWPTGESLGDRLPHIQSVAAFPNGDLLTGWSDGAVARVERDGRARTLARLAPSEPVIALAPTGLAKSGVGADLDPSPLLVTLDAAGARALLRSGTRVEVLDVRSGNPLVRGTLERLSDAVLTPDGRRLAMVTGMCERWGEGHCGSLLVLDAANGAVLGRGPFSEPEALLSVGDRFVVADGPNRHHQQFTVGGHALDGTPVWEVELEDRLDGNNLLIGSAEGAIVLATANESRVIRVSDGATVATLSGDRPRAAAFSPDGSLVALVDQGGWSLFSTADGRRIRREPVRGALQVWFASTDRLLVGSRDGILSWRLTSETPPSPVIPVMGEIMALATEPARVLLKTGGGPALRQVEFETGQEALCIVHVGPRREVCALQIARDAYLAKRSFADVGQSQAAAEAMLDRLTVADLPAQGPWAASDLAYASALREVVEALRRNLRGDLGRELLTRRLDDRQPLRRGAVRALLGVEVLRDGDPVLARRILELALTELREGGATRRYPTGLVRVISILAEVDLQLGRPEDSLRRLGEAQALADAAGEFFTSQHVSRIRAAALEQSGRWTEAEGLRQQLAQTVDDLPRLDDDQNQMAERLSELESSPDPDARSADDTLAFGLNLSHFPERTLEAAQVLSRAIERYQSGRPPGAPQIVLALGARARVHASAGQRQSALADFRAAAQEQLRSPGRLNAADTAGINLVHRAHVEAAWRVAEGGAGGEYLSALPIASGPVGHDAPVTSLTFSDDGSHLGSTDHDGGVILWDMSSLAEVWRVHSDRPILARPVVRDGRGDVVELYRESRPVAWLAKSDGALLAKSKNEYDLNLAVAIAQAQSAVSDFFGRQVKILTADGRTVHADPDEEPPGSILVGSSRREDGIQFVATADGETLIAVTGKEICIRRFRAGPTTCKPRRDQGAYSLVAASRDGRRIAAKSDSGMVVIDVDSARIRARLGGERTAAWVAAFSPDGRRLATGSEDGMVRVWDVRSGALVTVLAGHPRAVTAVAWSPEGTRLVTGGKSGEVHVWTSAGLLEARLGRGADDRHTRPIRNAVLSPDGSYLATDDSDVKQGGTRLWDVATGRLAGVLTRGRSIGELQFSPDSLQVVANSELFTVKSLRLRRRNMLGFLGEEGAFLVEGRDQVQVWSAREELLNTFESRLPALGVPASPDGAKILLDGGDRFTIGIVGQAKPIPLDISDHAGAKSMFFSNGRYLAVLLYNGGFETFDTTTGERVLKGDLRAGAWREIAGGGLWAQEGNIVRLLSPAANRPAVIVAPSAPSAVALTRDGRLAFVGLESGEILVADALSGAQVNLLKAHLAAVQSLSVDRVGALLASVGRDCTITIWDTKTWRRLRDVGAPGPATVEIDPPIGDRDRESRLCAIPAAHAARRPRLRRRSTLDRGEAGGKKGRLLFRQDSLGAAGADTADVHGRLQARSNCCGLGGEQEGSAASAQLGRTLPSKVSFPQPPPIVSPWEAQGKVE